MVVKAHWVIFFFGGGRPTAQGDVAQGLADQQRRLVRAAFLSAVLLARVPVGHHHLTIGPFLLLLLHQNGSLGHNQTLLLSPS